MIEAIRTPGVRRAGAALAVCLAAATSARAAHIVNDTWQDSTRTDPAAPVYSENGVNLDADADLESVWYLSGTSATLTAAPNSLVATPAAGSSASITSYITPEATPVTLVNPGDQMRLTWRFTTGNVAALPTGQDFRFAIVDSPNANRVSTDNVTPPGGAYTGYAIFGNMGETFNNSNPFQLRERGTTNGALLSAAAEWISFSPNINDGTSGNTGYVDATQYELVWTFTRNASNGLDIVATMTQLGPGPNVLDNGTGLSVSVTDATPNTFTFDTWHFRPSTGANTTSSFFDTQLFRVEFIVPEPSSIALLGLAPLALLRRRRRMR